MKMNQNKEDRHYTIYCHRNIINNKAYIGQTGAIPYTRRWQGHGVSGSPYKNCPHFERAIIKYGWKNFEHFVLLDNLTLEEANHYETLFIFLFNTLDPNYGYNVAKGGENHTHSEETKKKISEHHADFSGENHPMWGKHLSEETKEKIRQARLGTTHTEETKKKLSEATKGNNNPRAKFVLCIETGQIFSTAKEAAKWAGVNNSCLCKACNGRIKTSGGYHWEYITKEETDAIQEYYQEENIII